MRICDLLDPRAILLNASVSNKEQAINTIVDLISQTDCLNDPDRFRAAVFEREEKVSTGLGAGVAIPHAKSAGVSHPGLAAMVVPEGVDFDSLDGLPTKLFFLIASPHQASDAHLDVLARLSTLLISDDFRESLANCTSVDEFLSIINKAENDDIKEKEQKELQAKIEKEASEKAGSESSREVKTQKVYDIVAVTACPAGLSHTYMAAEALENKAKEMGVSINIETDGAAGNRNRLLPEDIARAKAVIVAADRIVEMDRFIGKPLVRVGVVEGIRRPQELIERALAPDCPRYQAGVLTSPGSLFMRMYRHLMSGLTYVMPIAATAGILSALARFEFLQSTQLGFFLDRIGYSIGTILFPILSAFIAFSIRGRTALVAGFTGGVMADLSSSGVIGAVVNGFIGGGVSLLITSFAARFLRGHDAIVALLLYPLVGALGTSVLALFITDIPASFIDASITNLIEGASTPVLMIIGAFLAGMMSSDMGGPLNKIAYATGVLLLANCLPEIGPGSLVMAAIMAGGMVPPLVASLASIIARPLFSQKEKENTLASLGKGLVFITEGVIPYLAFSPVKLRAVCILSSALAGALSMLFRCSACAPHGGIFIIPLCENSLLYLVSILSGTLFGSVAFIAVHLLERKRAVEAK